MIGHPPETDRTDVVVPAPCLVVLVGASGSGKSRFARRHFRPTEVLSSDRIRAMIADDEADQSVSAAAFEVLHMLARRRLEAGRVAVVDATNTAAEARRALLEIARACEAPAVAVVFEVPADVCHANDASRPGRIVGRAVVENQLAALAIALETIGDEGFAQVYRLRGLAAIDSARVVRAG